MSQYEPMAFDGMPNRQEVREIQIHDGVARQDYPDRRWEKRADEACEAPCHLCGGMTGYHVYSRGGFLWHFCAVCDSTMTSEEWNG